MEQEHNCLYTVSAEQEEELGEIGNDCQGQGTPARKNDEIFGQKKKYYFDEKHRHPAEGHKRNLFLNNT